MSIILEYFQIIVKKYLTNANQYDIIIISYVRKTFLRKEKLS